MTMAVIITALLNCLNPISLFPARKLMKCVNHPDYISLSFASPQQCLSSAVLNGGYQEVRSLLNLKVDQYAKPPFAPPAQTLNHKAHELALQPPVLGMMTAASMKSLRHRQIEVQTYFASVWVTCGLSNLLRPGDPVEPVPQMPPEPGTINIWLHCSHPLTPAAIAEALILLTEAKTTAVRDYQLKSRESGRDASGTGTDSHAVLCPSHSPNVTPLEYCGKHTHMGEAIGLAVYQAVSESIQACLDAGYQSPENISETSETIS